MPWTPTIKRGGPAPNVITGADPRPGHIPKPSRPDFTRQGNERNRRELQNTNGSPKTSNESLLSPDVAPNTSAVTNAVPGARDKNHKVPAPSTAPNVPGQQGKPLNGDAQESAPRNVSKHNRAVINQTVGQVISRRQHRQLCSRVRRPKSSRSTSTTRRASHR